MVFGHDVSFFFDAGGVGREEIECKERVIYLLWVFLFISGIFGVFLILFVSVADGEGAIEVILEVTAVDEECEGDIWFFLEGDADDIFDDFCCFVFGVL